jgi:O-antigen/teichoic acid export membrane protein
LALVVAAGLLLIPLHEAAGAAVAALIAESGLTAVLLFALVRGSPELRPSFRFVWKVALAAVVAGACALIPGVPSVPAAALAALAFGIVIWLTGALPSEVVAAIARRRTA